MPFVLRLAAGYHLLLFSAIWIIPGQLSLVGLDVSGTDFALGFWRAHAIGTSLGLGLGLLMASFNPVRQWAVIAASASVCATMVVFAATTAFRQPQSFFPWWHLTLGYGVWLLPLGIVLHDAWDEFIGRQRVSCPEIQRIAMRSRTSLGVSLDELSRLSPVMVVFLRHLGCPFCREALADLARDRAAIERDGTRLVLVHIASEEVLINRLAPSLSGVARLPDPTQVIYRAFGLGRGRLLDVFGPMVWFRFIEAAIFRGRGFGLQNDIFQMPGVFIIYHGQVIRTFRHQSIADRPDYLSLSSPLSQREFQGS